eukprot:CAMPEP_0119305088 /NCGR_PEP_ID=MMETSP1333-20130426/6167_1 /TAXON_ID=418940 /ORGANISM="Scyphosphaera apsteinii, Strain RCC1455" /LENGTH=164 /DNA_ID=CAMNT_0007308097 /DNA_START=251 /DNA_END=746 /DNA_ORIENTATION=+
MGEAFSYLCAAAECALGGPSEINPFDRFPQPAPRFGLAFLPRSTVFPPTPESVWLEGSGGGGGVVGAGGGVVGGGGGMGGVDGRPTPESVWPEKSGCRGGIGGWILGRLPCTVFGFWGAPRARPPCPVFGFWGARALPVPRVWILWRLPRAPCLDSGKLPVPRV